jgi:tetratricopeptide (TPR) repeat protein
MGRTRAENLAEEVAFSLSVRLEDRHESPHVFDKLCRIVDEMTTSGNRDSLRAARRAVRIAGRLASPGRCKLCQRPFPGTLRKTVELARGFARLAAALRLRCRYDHADAALRTALKMDPTDEIRGDLYRRRGLLRISQERKAAALADTRAALELAPAGRRRAVALLTLGNILYRTSFFEEAIQRLEEAVLTLDPAWEHQYTGALICYANALTKGTGKDARKGLEICAKARRRLKSTHKMQRAKLWWVEGTLYHRLGENRDAWRCLNISRLALVVMKFAPEVAAITSDMARIAMQPHTVENMCYEANKAIPEYHPLAVPLQALRNAGRSEIPAAAGVLRKAAEGLAACPPSF